MGWIVGSSHLKYDFLNELKHPLYKSIRLSVGSVGQPYVLLFVTRHHNYNLFLHDLPHPPAKFDDDSLQLGLVAELAHPHILMFNFQLVAVMHEYGFAVVQVNFSLSNLQRLVFND